MDTMAISKTTNTNKMNIYVDGVFDLLHKGHITPTKKKNETKLP